MRAFLILIIYIIMAVVTILSAWSFELYSLTYNMSSYHTGLASSIGNSSSYTSRSTLTFYGTSDDSNTSNIIADVGIFKKPKKDKDAPNVTVNYPRNNYSSRNITVIFNATVNDSYDIKNVSLFGSWGGWGVKYFNTSGANGIDYVFNFTVPEGIWVFGIAACDTSGNCFNAPNRTIYIDNTAGNVTLISPSNGSTLTSSPVTFTYNATDNVGFKVCSLYIDGISVLDDMSLTIPDSFVRSLADGTYIWTVDCIDYLNISSINQTFTLTMAVSGGASSGGSTSREYEEPQPAVNISSIIKAARAAEIKAKNMKILMFLLISYFAWLLIATKMDKKKYPKRDIFIKGVKNQNTKSSRET